MKTENIKIYIAEDGERFNDREQCIKYESHLHLVQDLQEKYLHPSPEEKVTQDQFNEGLCYIQHNPELFKKYEKELFDYILLQYISIYMDRKYCNSETELWEYKNFKERVWNLDDSSLDYVENYLNSPEERSYYFAWKRVVNTDSDFREWAEISYSILNQDMKIFALNR
jgi:hypothetical protein